MAVYSQHLIDATAVLPAVTVPGYTVTPGLMTTIPAVVLSSEGFESGLGGWGPGADSTLARVAYPAAHPNSGTWALEVQRSTNTPGQVQAKRTVTGLVIGRSYILTGWPWNIAASLGQLNSFKLGVTGIGYGASANPGGGGTGSAAQATYSFVATATAHDLLLEHTSGTESRIEYTRGSWDDVILSEAARSVWTPPVVVAPITIPSSTYRLNIKTASVTLDEGWSPYAQAELVCSVPTIGQIEALDPRNNLRVKLTLTQSFGESLSFAAFNKRWAGKTIAQFNTFYAGKTLADFNREYIAPWGGVSYREPVKITLDLSMRARTVDHEAGTVTFSLASDEGLLQDFALVAASPADPATTSVRSAVFYALAKIGVSSLSGALDATVDAAATVWQPGVSAWDYVAPLVQKAGFRLWCDGGRVWRLTKGYTVDGQINLSAETGVKRATDTVSREAEWFDSVVITYKWNDSAGVSHVAYDIAGAPGTKTLAINYDATVFPGAGAATGVLERAQGRGRVLDVEALSNYATAPGIPLSITLPNTPIQTGVVSAVTWQFPADTMTVKSRALVDTSITSWQLVPAGRRWQDVATGVKWNTYTP